MFSRVYCLSVSVSVKNTSFCQSPFLHIPVYSIEQNGEKSFKKTLWKKVKLLKMDNFTFFHKVFFIQSVSKDPFIATFQLSFAASLNSGWYKDGV